MGGNFDIKKINFYKHTLSEFFATRNAEKRALNATRSAASPSDFIVSNSSNALDA
jgi:hypothetical protein